jgi:D-sedoheptulose 7-phosphate isomerase
MALNFDVLNSFQHSLSQLVKALTLLQSNNAAKKSLSDAFHACIKAYEEGNKVLIAGNGGSAADAQHLAGKLVSRFNYDRPPLSAIALTTDTSIITAVSNDYGYKYVFARQIQAHGRLGDVFIVISTSGNSSNILEAIQTAKSLGLVVIGLAGQCGGEMKGMCDICFSAPSESTPRIQECQLFFEHALCACIEESLFSEYKK